MKTPTGHPALGFFPYGLDPNWQGRRWLEFFEGSPGYPAWCVWLGHEDPRTGTVVVVRTVEDALHNEQMQPADSRQDLAFAAAFAHLNLCLQQVDDPVSRETIARQTAAVAEHEAEHVDVWPSQEWRFQDQDGEITPITGKLWTFAGWWTVLLPSHKGRTVIVHGHGPVPPERRLAALDDTTGYGFQRGEPLHLDMLDSGQLSGFLAHETAIHPDLTARFDLPKAPGAI
ncbi:hypothetical protein [Streptomyces sp. NBC_00989]|uniref:hypothetical protein n=1 Tax=Streptomyces sp. NBC_00989 TaxID=2903705 RepID=UPI003866D34E|nr:hypothetical protein OG714_44390 [Streptomyces sp. NBC_00989]